MKRGDVVLHESAGPGKMRTRTVRRATLTKRQAWTEWTNQPGDGDWHYLSLVYGIHRGRKGTVRVVTGYYALSLVTALEMSKDLRELAIAGYRRP